jgi:peptide/nickel transport system permease protein
LAITWVGYLARLVRASLLEVLNQTYIRAEMAAGIPQRKIYYRYALKNAIIPTVAVLGVGIGKLMAGAVFVELIFTRPGMGTLIYNAIQARNFPIVRAGVLVVAFLFVAANLVADILYTYLDPRIQLGTKRG